MRNRSTRREFIVVAVKPLIPRFGVIHTRRESPKKGVFVRNQKHRREQYSSCDFS